MEYQIRHNGIKGFENLNFTVDLQAVGKAAKNRSYPNLTNCCKAHRKQKYNCEGCQKDVTAEKSGWKEFKMGKEQLQLPTEQLEAIKDSLDSNKVLISALVPVQDIKRLFQTEKAFYAGQAKKEQKEYIQYREVLNAAGLAAVGMANLRERPYPIALVVEGRHLVMLCLHFREELNTPKDIEEVAVNPALVELLAKVAKQQAGAFSLDTFVNTRDELELKLVEKLANGEALPEVKQEIEQKQQVQEQSEIERLQEMLREGVMV